jgi:hypothetical protein
VSAKFRECAVCYFNNHAPEICEGCTHASEFQPIDSEPEDDELAGLDTDFSTQDFQ